MNCHTSQYSNIIMDQKNRPTPLGKARVKCASFPTITFSQPSKTKRKVWCVWQVQEGKKMYDYCISSSAVEALRKLFR